MSNISRINQIRSDPWVTLKPTASGSTPVSMTAIVTWRPSYFGYLLRNCLAPVVCFGKKPQTGKFVSISIDEQFISESKFQKIGQNFPGKNVPLEVKIVDGRLSLESIDLSVQHLLSDILPVEVNGYDVRIGNYLIKSKTIRMVIFYNAPLLVELESRQWLSSRIFDKNITRLICFVVEFENKLQ